MENWIPSETRTGQSIKPDRVSVKQLHSKIRTVLLLWPACAVRFEPGVMMCHVVFHQLRVG